MRKALRWQGQGDFEKAPTVPWRPLGELAGYRRSAGTLSYYTLLHTGHLVPMIVPEVAKSLLKEAIEKEQALVV